MKRRLSLVAAALSTFMLAPMVAAEAAATPAPTVKVTMAKPGTDDNATMADPAGGLKAAWAVKSVGKDATFTARAPVALLSLGIDARWTSNVVAVRRGRTVGRATLTWLAVQADPVGTDNTQQLRVRFTNQYGRWQSWRTVTTRLLAAPTSGVPAEKTVTYSLKYPGPLSTGRVRMQVMLLDKASRVSVFQQTLGVRLS